MKTKSLLTIFALISTIILVWVGPIFSSEFPSLPAYVPGDEALIANEAKIDSLEIIKMPDGKYYIYCSVCPIVANNGFLQKKILDTLNSIDPAIPERFWLTAYVMKNFIYKSDQNVSRIKFENGWLSVNNRFDDYYTILSNKRLQSYVVREVQKNSATDARNFGMILMLCLIGLGLAVGLAIYKCKTIIFEVATALVGAVPMFLFMRYMFLQTDKTLMITMGMYIMGNIFMLLILAMAFPKKKADAKK